MNYETHNDVNVEINVSGTSLQGYLAVSYDVLVDAFGEPTGGDDYKTDAEWLIKFEDGSVATIYNYKNGNNYNNGGGIDVEDIELWHIGGFDKSVADKVEVVIG